MQNPLSSVSASPSDGSSAGSTDDANAVLKKRLDGMAQVLYLQRRELIRQREINASAVASIKDYLDQELRVLEKSLTKRLDSRLLEFTFEQKVLEPGEQLRATDPVQFEAEELHRKFDEYLAGLPEGYQ